MEINARVLEERCAGQAKPVMYRWKSSLSKNPHHLRFGVDGQICYMRDGIITTSNGLSGVYDRILEFAGPDRDEHEVVLEISCPIYDGDVVVSAGE